MSVEVVSRHVALGSARPRRDYRPAMTLDAFGFEAVEETVIPVVEHLSPTQSSAHVRSMRLWEEVPPSLHDTIEAELRSNLAGRLYARGTVRRRLSVATVWGRKP